MSQDCFQNTKFKENSKRKKEKGKLKFRPWVAIVKTIVGWFLFSVQLPCIHTTGFKYGNQPLA
jgi:hypothetical protein